MKGDRDITKEVADWTDLNKEYIGNKMSGCLRHGIPMGLGKHKNCYIGIMQVVGSLNHILNPDEDVNINMVGPEHIRNVGQTSTMKDCNPQFEIKELKMQYMGTQPW